MTGRELMMFILENKLEDTNIFSDEVLSSICMTIDEAAVKFNTGYATVSAWAKMGSIPTLKINDKTYVYKEAKDPRTQIDSPKKKRLLSRLKSGKKTYITVKPRSYKEMVDERTDNI